MAAILLYAFCVWMRKEYSGFLEANIFAKKLVSLF